MHSIFCVINDQVTKFVDSLVIDDCDQPFPPLIVIQKLDADRIVVTWQLDQKYQTSNTKAILSFGIEWCKLPKSYLKRDEKESKKKKRHKKKKRKKDKKKRKKRKRKKRKHSTSSEDEDEEDGDEAEEDDIAKQDDIAKLESPKTDDKAEGDKVTKPLFKFGSNASTQKEAVSGSKDSKESKSSKKKGSKKKKKKIGRKRKTCPDDGDEPYLPDCEPQRKRKRKYSERDN